IMGLIPMPPGKIESGTAVFDGIDLLSCGEKQMRKIRGSRIAMIFQDPMTSLNPYLRIRQQLVEPLLLHTDTNKSDALKLAINALGDVGISDPESRIQRYPHEFSGGMRQRVMIAMALIAKPEILIADEPTTALDVTIQAEILELIKERREKLGMSVIFITHDLAVISQVCDTINVMYAGRIVERASNQELFKNPLHAYTRSLLKSIPAIHDKDSELYTIPGLPPNPATLGPGCAFHERNTLGDPSLCLTNQAPPFEEIQSDHFAQNCPGCLAYKSKN
ncbi:MAG: ABC transporter ATP-binding protein, partial [Verrucomicrobia bacterium]|nr:ABC transporter ATP-binding protein [Verrucomicrobiota bacterium]